MQKQQAARVLATMEGVTQQPPCEPEAKPKPFELVYDKSLFDNLDDLECEQSEKEEMRKILADLQAAQNHLDTKASDVTIMLANAEAVRRSITDRMAKKRRAEGEGAQAPDEQPAPQAAPPPAAVAEPAAAAAAAAIPEGQEAAVAAAKGWGKGDDVQQHNDKVKAEAAKLSAAKFAAQQHAEPGQPSH